MKGNLKYFRKKAIVKTAHTPVSMTGNKDKSQKDGCVRNVLPLYLNHSLCITVMYNKDAGDLKYMFLLFPFLCFFLICFDYREEN